MGRKLTDPFTDLPRGYFGAILADPPWTFTAYSGKGKVRSAERHYDTMSTEEIAQLPVADLAADDCCLFMWVSWPLLPEALRIIERWGFTFKTCGFDWMKAHAGQIDMFRDDADVQVGMGYWTRSNTEPCLLATRGSPKRLNADVRMGIIEPRREHSRKPDVVYNRIERLVAGPYLDLFARQSRHGWTTWGAESTKFDRAAYQESVNDCYQCNVPYDGQDDFAKSLDVGYSAIRERMAAGGKGWEPKTD